MSAVTTTRRSYNLGKWVRKPRLEDSGWEGFDIALEMALDKAVNSVKKDARKWATNVKEYWTKNVPVDTGNLRDSIEIDDHLNDDSPYILVGVNEEKLKGPKYKRSTLSKKAVYRRIPPYNYVPYAEENARNEDLKFFVKRLWLTYAEKEAGRIFK